MINRNDIEKEIEKLHKEGVDLLFSMFKLKPEMEKKLDELGVDKKSLPIFKNDYENWYTKSYRLIEKVAPYRLKDFVALYKIEKRKELKVADYSISDALLGSTWSLGSRVVAEPFTAYEKMKMQTQIVGSLKALINDYFYNLELDLETNIFDKELDSANELLKKKFLRPAGVVAGVVLEKHLKNVCTVHNIVIQKKNLTISDYNDKLKESDIINVPTWRKIQLLGDLRNLCAHNKDVEPTEQDVIELISGTKTIISTLF